jgi:PTS system galactitol-specific IIA component
VSNVNEDISLEGLILTEDNIVVGLQGKDYKDIIRKIAERLLAGNYVKDTFVQAVLDREEEFPTGLQVSGGGVAIPHSDSEYVKKSTLGIATLASPVDFRMMAEPDKIVSVSVVIMLAVADKKKVVPVLRKVISILKNEEAIIALEHAQTKTEIKKILINHINEQSERMKN